MKMNNVLRKFGIALLVLLFVSAFSYKSMAQIKYTRDVLRGASTPVVTLVHVKGHGMADDGGLNNGAISTAFVLNEKVEQDPKLIRSTNSGYAIPPGNVVGSDALSWAGTSLEFKGTGTMLLNPAVIYAAYYPSKSGERSTGSPEYLDDLCKDHWKSIFALPIKNGFIEGTLQLLGKTIEYKAPVNFQLKMDCRVP